MRYDATKALRNKEIFYLPIEKYLNKIFVSILYRPLLDIISGEIGDTWVKENSKEDLVKAILSGRIQYTRTQHFEGKFSSSISREIVKLGGRWDKKEKRWYVPKSLLPYDVLDALGQASLKFTKLSQDLTKKLDELQKQLSDPQHLYELEPLFEGVVGKLEESFQEGIKGILIAPELTGEMSKNIAEKWGYNLNLYIKNWEIESIIRLRERVLSNTFAGNRAQSLVEMIEHDFGMSENKAKFLARQETALLMSQFREERFKSAGVQKYRWSTSGDSRVRERHKALQGQIFTWDNPPIIDEAGHRGHPGQDFNCRCIAIPLVS